MIAAWTRWRISTAIEEGKPLSPALARKVRRDPECRQFYEASLAMVKRLRRDANQIAQNEPGGLGKMRPLGSLEVAPIDSSRNARRLRPVSAVTAAAVVIGLALGGAVWWWPVRPSAPQPAPSIALRESDVTEVSHLLRQIKDNVELAVERKAPQWQQIIARSGDALRAPIVREAENMASDTRHILQAFSSMILRGDDVEPSDSEEEGPSPSSSGRSGQTQPLSVS